jgi:hypothetical protein
MSSLYTEAAALAQGPTAERLRALRRLVPRARIQAILRRTGQARRRSLRLPAWFMVWYVIALGLFCRASYRQVFKWLQPFRRKGTPGAPRSARPASGWGWPRCSTSPSKWSNSRQRRRRRAPSIRACG